MGLEIFELGLLPRWLRVRQKLDEEEIGDVAAAVAAEFTSPEIDGAIVPGTRVAITASSRGIDRQAEVIAAVVAEVKRRGGIPFIVPGMGSQGGSTAEGQLAVATGYHVTEENVGAPVRSCMDTVQLGEVLEHVPVYFDRLAATEADAVIPVSRVKQHTDFHAPMESGLCKMLAIGLGKQKGAHAYHAHGLDRFHILLPEVAKLVMSKLNVPFGIALIENGVGRLAVIEAVPGRRILTREPELLNIARAKLPRLPGEDIDVLAIDYLGKGISGAGADTNVINRYYAGRLPEKPHIQRIIVRSLTAETDGNAAGIGLADFALRQAIAQVDPVKTYINTITSKTVEGARMPVAVENDRQALYVAIASCMRVKNHETARIARIRDTKHIGTFFVSEPFYRELAGAVNIEVIEEAHDIQFDAAGMFTEVM